MNFNISNCQQDCKQRNKTQHQIKFLSPLSQNILLACECFLLNQVIYNYLLLNSPS